MRALRFAFTRRPRPGITKMPDFLVSLIAVSASVSRNVAAVLLLVSSFSAIWRTSCVFVMPAAIRISSLNCERRGSIASQCTSAWPFASRFYAGFFNKAVENPVAIGLLSTKPTETLMNCIFGQHLASDSSGPAKYIRMTFEAHFSSADARDHVAPKNRHPGAAFL